jgi:hypothetical protein
VHGSLQMVEFYGAALLAEEMEQLVAMQQGASATVTKPCTCCCKPSGNCRFTSTGCRAPAATAAGGAAADQRPAQCPR